MSRESIVSGDTAGNKRRAATSYGRRDIESKHPSVHAVSQGQFKQVVPFSYDTLPSFGLDELILRVPQNAFLVSAKLRVVEAFAGGTSYLIGLYEEDGTEIDADGLFTAFLLAEVDAVGETVLGDGALIGALAGLAERGQVVVAATGTFTAGKAQLELVYQELEARV